GLGIPRGILQTWKGWLLVVACGALLAVEMATAYSLELTTPQCFHVPDESFERFMQTVRASPGEAVLDWPIQVYAGNANLGPLEKYDQLCTVYAFRQFHTKKTVGMYFGRIHPSQLIPLYDAGWDKLLLPDPGAPSDASQPSQAGGAPRDFTEDDWE